MDRALVGLILAGIILGAIAGAYILAWLLDHTIRAITKLRRPR